MGIREILIDILSNYTTEKEKTFANNRFAKKVRNLFVQDLSKILISKYKDRYIIKGSCGQGQWANCPWIVIMDSIITDTPQKGYYLVYLFDKQMRKVYLSLNQGVTNIKKEFGKEAPIILSSHAKAYRKRLTTTSKRVIKKIDLSEGGPLADLYEIGNIWAICYDRNNMPDEETLLNDFDLFLSLYQELTIWCSDEISTSEAVSINADKTVEENKVRKLHAKFDRKGDISTKVKVRKGYQCEACGLIFSDKYGELGREFIEAHHLIPYSELNEGKTELNIDSDFAVLCSNCHRMIHRLPDPSDLNKLKEIIKRNKT